MKKLLSFIAAFCIVAFVATLARGELFERYRDGSLVQRDSYESLRASGASGGYDDIYICAPDTTTWALRQTMDRADYKDIDIRINGSVHSLRVCRYLQVCAIPGSGEPLGPGFEARCLTEISSTGGRPLCPSRRRCEQATYSRETEERLASEEMPDNYGASTDPNQAPFLEPVQ